MIGTQRLSKILSVLAASDIVSPAERRLSAILIAPSDAGKSALLLSHLPPNARVLDDFTSAGLYHLLDQEKKPEWIVVPDFNAVISHKQAVANLTVANLLALLGEGTTEILGPDGSKTKISDKPIKIGLLTGVTPDMFFSKRGRWRATGFLRRMIPIYYSYNNDTQNSIQDSIANGKDPDPYPRAHVRIPRGAPRAVNIPGRLRAKVRKLSEQAITYQLGWGKDSEKPGSPRVRAFEMPFSIHKTYRRYIQTHARLHERTVATERDFAALEDFHSFVRYDQPELL